MNFEHPEGAVREALAEACRQAWNHVPESIPLSYPPNAALGDLASPLCFELAKVLKKSPREIAGGITDTFKMGEHVAKIEVAGPGYLNVYLNRESYLKKWLGQMNAPFPSPKGGKRIVEHTNINPNKAAHIGHIRNAVLGDTLVRCLLAVGKPVEIQNYIDDTGVQVADLVVGFIHIRGERLQDVTSKYSQSALAERGERFDYIAWDLYAEVTRWYEEDETRLKLRAETLHAMEEGEGDIATLANHVAQRMVQHHLSTMLRLGVRYDVLPHESDILKLNFWEHAFELLKSSGALMLATEGKNEGCWVMNLEGVQQGAGEDQKIIVRSNGTVTYVGKDIAYQMWKFGLLGRDFHYKPFSWDPLPELYKLQSTCSHPTDTNTAFGKGDVVYNVIDTRQSYLQRVVKQALVALGHHDEAERSIHFAYEMVALSPAAIEALFPEIELSEEDQQKAYIEMSGRKGLGVRADELMDTLEARAYKEVLARSETSEASDDEVVKERARRIAIGALRYYMLRFSKNRVVAFDLDDALSFEGETGPYVQYSVLRARNILAKTESMHNVDSSAEALIASIDLASLPEEALHDHWALATLIARTPHVLTQAIDSLELSTVAKHAHVLAQTFNSFYHRYKVAQEADETIRNTRLAFVRFYHDSMIRLLDRMGIEVPDRM